MKMEDWPASLLAMARVTVSFKRFVASGDKTDFKLYGESPLAIR